VWRRFVRAVIRFALERPSTIPGIGLALSERALAEFNARIRVQAPRNDD
jgi:hypothetical protein